MKKHPILRSTFMAGLTLRLFKTPLTGLARILLMNRDLSEAALADVLQNRCPYEFCNILCWSLFLFNFITKRLQVFSCEFCEIFKKIFFYRAPMMAAFDL